MKKLIKQTKIKMKRATLKLRVQTKIYKNLHSKPNSIRYLSARYKAYQKFGKNILDKLKRKKVFVGKKGREYFFGETNAYYESENVIGIDCVQKNLNANTISRIGLGFEKNTLIIESMQNNNLKKNYLNEFRRLSKEQTLDFMLKQIEKTAKENGFKKIKIRRPEFLYWFQNAKPVLNPQTNEYDKKYTQRQIKILYQKIALRYGFKPKRDFYVKELI
ncbi:MAG: hypothetical protein PHP82_01305 [Candidatus ainarchaeum sp.]|nr:hypothetical protein [Candidatus ainarchaeum sp.]